MLPYIQALCSQQNLSEVPSHNASYVYFEAQHMMIIDIAYESVL